MSIDAHLGFSDRRQFLVEGRTAEKGLAPGDFPVFLLYDFLGRTALKLTIDTDATLLYLTSELNSFIPAEELITIAFDAPYSLGVTFNSLTMQFKITYDSEEFSYTIPTQSVFFGAARVEGGFQVDYMGFPFIG